MAYTSWQNWANILDFIKHELGAETMQLEITDQKMVEMIQMHVLPEFSGYDGLRKYYKMTEDCIISRDPIVEYQFKDFPYKIFKVINKIDQANFVDFSQVFGQASVGDITDFLVRQNYMDMADMARADNTWRFMPPDKFQVTKAGFTYLTDEFILELDVCHNDPTTISPGLYDSFRDLACAYIMNALGKIRKKYNNFNTPFGNIQLNADELVQDAKDLRQRTLEELKRTPPEQYIYFL